MIFLSLIFEAEAAAGNPEVACWWLRLKLSPSWSMLWLIRIGCQGWTTLTFSSPTLAAPKPTAAVAQMLDSQNSIVQLQRFLEVVSTGSWSGCQNTCVWSNCFQALQMLQQLSILHQEDENERVQSLAANDGSNESWIWRKSIEAKDDIEAMTLFKMAKVGITWTFKKDDRIRSCLF